MGELLAAAVLTGFIGAVLKFGKEEVNPSKRRKPVPYVTTPQGDQRPLDPDVIDAPGEDDDLDDT